MFRHRSNEEGKRADVMSHQKLFAPHFNDEYEGLCGWQ